ncbi:MAG: hypothetical protein IKS99_02090 [Firmicutes bacterium]|nr:hypothetical protein [Bacillota bacterium]
MDTIKETIEVKKKHVKKSILKVVAVAVSTGLLAVGAVAALDNLQGPGSGLSQVTEPEPVVLDIDEADMTDESDSGTEDEQQEKKRGFFSWLKIWFYGVLTGIAGFFATKIPWRKIFTKRNLIILLVLVAVFLCAKYLLPQFVDVPWGPDVTKAE